MIISGSCAGGLANCCRGIAACDAAYRAVFRGRMKVMAGNRQRIYKHLVVDFLAREVA
jgi:hypothetical protein